MKNTQGLLKAIYFAYYVFPKQGVNVKSKPGIDISFSSSCFVNLVCRGIDVEALELLCYSGRPILLPSHTGFHLGGEISEIHQHAFLLGVAFFETHLLDADFAVGEFVFTQNDGEGDTTLFGGLELLWELGLNLVGELGLSQGLVDILFCNIPQAQSKARLTLTPAFHKAWQTLMRSVSMPLKPLPPKAMTKASTSLLRRASALFSRSRRALVMEKIRSTPNETPTQGI